MSFGNFAGGLVQGGIAVNKMFNDNSDQKIKEQAAEENQYKFDKQKAFDKSMEDISKREADATSTQPDTSITTPVESQPVQSEATESEPVDANNAPADHPDFTPAKEPQAQPAPAPAKPALSPLSKSGFGAAPDPVNKYRFALERAAAYDKLGDFKSANEIKKNATLDATGEFANAILSGDRQTAFDMYQTYPNGHYLKNLSFGKDEKGNDTVITEDVNGNKVVSNKMDILIGAIAHSGDTEKALTMLTNRMNAEDKNALYEKFKTMDEANKTREYTNNVQRQKDLMDLRDRIASQNLQARYDLSGGRGGASSGSGRSGNAKPPEGYNPDGTINIETFFNGLKATDPESAKAQTDAYSIYQRMAQSAGDVPPAYQWQIAKAAKDVAAGTARIVPELGSDGMWDSSVINNNGVGIPYQKGIQPTGLNDASGKPLISPEKVIQTIQAKFPTQYDGALKAINTPNGIANLQALVANPATNNQDKQDAQIALNLASQIQQYKGGNRSTPEAKQGTNSPTQPAFSQAEIDNQKRLGITPNKPLSQRLGEVAGGIRNTAKESMNAIAKQSLQEKLDVLHSGDTSAYNANTIYALLQKHPELQVSPDDLAKIHAYSTDYQTRTR